MDESTTGLILRTRPLTESSLIVHWVTRDYGRLSTVAKGARRPRSPFLGKLDLFYLADFTFHLSRRSELHTLREVQLRADHREIRLDLACLQQASYFTQLIELSTETNTPLPGFFELLAGVLPVLPRAEPGPLLVYAFEMRLLDLLGLGPDPRQARLPPGTRQILSWFTAPDWTLITRIKVTKGQAEELDDFLRGCLASSLGLVPKGRTAACTVGRVMGAGPGIRTTTSLAGPPRCDRS